MDLWVVPMSFLFLFLSLFYFFFNFTILYWFCHISTWIRYRYTRVPHPEPSSHLPPCTIPLGCPSAPAPSIQYRASNLDWRLISYMILYMFQCHFPKSSHPWLLYIVLLWTLGCRYHFKKLFILYWSIAMKNVLIVSGKQWRDSAIHIHVSILPQTSLPCRLPRIITFSRVPCAIL